MKFDIQAVLDNYVASGLVYWFILFTFIFSAIGYIWAALDVYGVLKDATDFVNAFNDINTILSFVYYIWLNNNLHGYSARPEQYRRFLFDVTRLSQDFYAFTITNNDNLKNLKEYRDIAIGMAFYSFRMYAQDDKTVVLPTLDINKDDLSRPEIFIMGLITKLNILFAKMETQNVIKFADARTLAVTVDSLQRTMKEQDIGNNVVTPNFFNNHIRFVLGVYFLFYIPFRLAVAIGWLSIIVYPIIMNILVGIVIIRYWLRDPFDEKRPWRGMDTKGWRYQTMRNIDTILNAEEVSTHTSAKYKPISHNKNYETNSGQILPANLFY
jgi:hypothetical protein